MMAHTSAVRLLSLTLITIISSGSGSQIILSCNGPVTLDAPITFFGRLTEAEKDSTYQWNFRDNASPSHENSTELLGTVSERNYTIAYPSSMYDAYEYKMTLSIYKYFFNMFWKEVGSEDIVFNITRNLNGRLVVRQNGQIVRTLEGKNIVSSINITETAVELNDPQSYIANAYKIQYFWTINSVPYGQTSQDKFSYNFSTPGEYTIEAIVIADFNASVARKFSHEEARDLTQKPHQQAVEEGRKYGVFHKRVMSKAPISNISVIGKTMLKHGQLVDLNIVCNGTGPWLYCYSRQKKGYNITGNETCEDPLQRSVCDFSILQYIPESDTYNFLLIISNDVSSIIKVVPVTVYEVARHVPISIVIIPVAASIVVVIILISGIALYSRFKRNLPVEVADFDFNNAESEDLQYKTFWERLRESFGNAFTAQSETESEGSSVSGMRSAQLPGASGGMGYGTIS